MEFLQVVCAILFNKGQVLITRRPSGKHLEHFWEFPGGKVNPRETLVEALKREIHEELGVHIQVGTQLEQIEFHYPDRSLQLHFFQCSIKRGTLQAHQVSELKWVDPAELDSYSFPPADRRLIRLLQSQRNGPD